MAGNDYDPIPRAITRAIHAADSYDDVPRAWLEPGATVISVLAPYTMDELLEWRMGARAGGRDHLADALSREINRRAAEDEAMPEPREVPQ